MSRHERNEPKGLGLFGATGVGVGAIVGGGILALAGIAFERSGPGAILAFALNGVIAIITALAFAELSSRFPESGGTYVFARKVLSVHTAFFVGWTMWFASIVAATLYAIGFAEFASTATFRILSGWGLPAEWVDRPVTHIGLALAATLAYSVSLARRPAGGGAFINITKVIVFTVLVIAGLVSQLHAGAEQVTSHLRPFLPAGLNGLVEAMGFTFIALQGFDLIAAVAGDVRKPSRTIPRAMLLSLGIALAIYIPLLLVITTVGVGPDETIQAAAAVDPETIVARAAQRFLGPVGYWLIIAAGVLAMLSALQANLFAASRVARAMARDRTLPRFLERTRPQTDAPVAAVAVTAVITAILILLLGDVSDAGAAASLIFLVTFALANGMSILARRRGAAKAEVFRSPLFPVLPVIGGLACISLALFQGIEVPRAGLISIGWLALGVALFAGLFSRQAAIRDAASESVDPQLLRLRGRAPLVLVPIANPAHAVAMLDLADALAPPWAGRVLMLSVVRSAHGNDAPFGEALARAQTLVASILQAADRSDAPDSRPIETLLTIAADPWHEIARVARMYRCESVLFGLPDSGAHPEDERHLEGLIGSLETHVVVLRAPDGWRLDGPGRVLVPVAGRGRHAALRARLVSALSRSNRAITYVRVIAPDAPAERDNRVRRMLVQIAQDEAHGAANVLIERSDEPVAAIAALAAPDDLVILGMQRRGRDPSFGAVADRMANELSCAVLVIGER